MLFPFALWCLGCLLPAPLFALSPVPADKPATFPAWWYERDVIVRNNTSVTTPLLANNDYPASDDFAAVNQGQVKVIVKAAVNELNSRTTNVPGGAGTVLDGLVAKWTAAAASGESREDYAPVNIGQLKTVSALIYDRLTSAGYYDQIPWAYNPGGANDFTTVNLGQLKNLFRFDVSVSPTLPGGITRDVWTGISGTVITSIPLATTPTITGSLSSFESQYSADNYGERICGYLKVAATGNYKFWLTASDSAELYISNDEDPVNAFLRAEVKIATTQQDWGSTNAGKSTLLLLEAGRRYYVEVRHKSGTGADHVSVGWTTPSSSTTTLVPGSALSRRISGPAPLFSPPSAVTWTDPNSSSNPESHLHAGGAARFLIQTTFGPSGWATNPAYGASGGPVYGASGGWTDAAIAGPNDIPYDVAQVQSRGFSNWIDDQIAITPSKLYDYVQLNHLSDEENTVTGHNYGHELFYASWWRTAVTGRDQLRQRVAFALSEIMVISLNAALASRADSASDYYDDALAANAFGNFRDLLKSVTLHPAMGVYLDGLRNNKAASGRLPNENYARELMQLFSIGMNRLNPDGTLLLNAAGQPIPTYNQAVVEGMSRVLSGWDFDYVNTAPGYDPYYPNVQEWLTGMEANPAQHELGEKCVLNNVVLPGVANSGSAGYSTLAGDELDAVLDAIVNHPNCGPFICRQLIQRLVTSDPSPEYVYRVVAKFNDDDSSGHVRGSMTAVIKAILLDPEARSASMLSAPKFGKQREPLCRITAFARAFPSLEYTTSEYTTTYSGVPKKWVNEWNMRQTSYIRDNGQENLNQTPLMAPTVFNFFRPDYQFPGVLARAGMTTPEFQLSTDSAVIDQMNVVHNSLINWDPHVPKPGLASLMTGRHTILMDFRPWLGNAANGQPWTDDSNLEELIDKLNIRLTGGRLPSSGTNTYHPPSGRNIVNARQAIVDFISPKAITAVSAAGSPVTVTVAQPHGLVDGERIFFKTNIGGSFTPAFSTLWPRPDYAVTVTGPTTFTIPVVRNNNNAVNLTNAAISRMPSDDSLTRLRYIVNLLVNSPDFIIQR